MASANLGNVIIQALTVADDATVDGTLTVEGSATLAALTVTGPADLAGGLTAGGSATQTGSDLVLGNPGNGRTLDWTGLGTPAPYMDVYGNLRFPNATSGDNWNISDVSGNVVLTVYNDGTKVVETANSTLDNGAGGIITGGSLSGGNFVRSDLFWFQSGVASSSLPSGAGGLYYDSSYGPSSTGTLNATGFTQSGYAVQQGIDHSSWTTNDYTWSFASYPTGTPLQFLGMLNQSTAGTMYLMGMSSPAVNQVVLSKSTTTGVTAGWAVVQQPT